MGLGTIFIATAIAALLLTAFMDFGLHKVKNWFLSFFQNFSGALFVFSGAVKAIDPLGTAYKMEQYFEQFEVVFKDTWFSFLAPLFPKLAEYSAGFSVFMIVFEIVLGLFLLIGAYRKFTAWAFLLLVLFFTFLTGFTYLTGYVPEGVNFFQFGQWGSYVETNMKVTDCGCFGDFIKLKPKVSFFKDLFLLIPAFLFLFRSKHMHRLFSAPVNMGLAIISTALLTVYCMSNFVWNLPDVDFRPFKVGVNIREQMQAELDALNAVDILAYKMTNKKTGEVVELPYDQYMKEFQKYPGAEWELEQVKSEPAVAQTKISEFEVSDLQGNNVTDTILADPNYSFMVIAYKLYGAEDTTIISMYADTLYVPDTIRTANSMEIGRKAAGVRERRDTVVTKAWKDEAYLKAWQEKINPILMAGKKDGLNGYAITAYLDAQTIEGFRKKIGAEYQFYTADDILLKTIIRSNPGLVLLKDGKVVMNWHYRQLPDYAKIKEKFLK
jgi:hypothetical protein